MIRYLFIILLAIFVTQAVTAKEERVRFNLKLGFIKGGEAEMVITDTVFNGIPAIHYYVVGRTTGLAHTLYGVHDIYETTVDANTHLPLKAIRNVQEGNYRLYNETLFYHDVDSINSQRSGWRKVPDDLIDIISVFFYFIHKNPFNNIQPGDAVKYATYHNDKISDVSVKFLREERIKTDAGNMDSYVLAPTVDKGKLLKRSDGLRFYISKERKVPVLLEFDMRVGALRAVLKSYKIDGVEQVAK
ncbi:MAG: DUF3108 domain-containing protein [Bacteroidota bacterium]